MRGRRPRLKPVDLFGFPAGKGSARMGRPRHLATAERRELVRRMRAEGATQAEIAAALGVSWPTLSKYYRAEIA